MVQIYKINSSGPVRLDEMQEGCWINMVAPSEEEMLRIHEELNIPLDFLRDALDQEERAHIDFEDGVTQIVIDVPMLEVEGKSFLYTTMPLGIIHTDDYILTICLQESSLLLDFIDGRVRNVLTAGAMTRAVTIASGLGVTSARTWLKLPVVEEMDRVVAATTLPVLLLGGEVTADPDTTLASWRKALALPGVLGLVAGRTMLYPPGDDVAAAVDAALEVMP